MTNTQQEKLVQEYRAHLVIPGMACSITAENLATAKDGIQKVLGGNARIEQVDPQNFVVYHSHWNQGKTPLGYINSRQVPQDLSVQQLIETRAAQAA